MNLVQQAELIPPSVQNAATAGFDGQIHDAPSRLRCHQVQASCYQPTPTRQTSSPQGEGRYGYRSLPAQLVAPTWRVNWTLDEAELAPANTHEESLAGDLLRRLVGEYSWLRVTTAVGDAGLGYEPFLGVYLPTTLPPLTTNPLCRRSGLQAAGLHPLPLEECWTADAGRKAALEQRRPGRPLFQGR